MSSSILQQRLKSVLTRSSTTTSKKQPHFVTIGTASNSNSNSNSNCTRYSLISTVKATHFQNEDKDRNHQTISFSTSPGIDHNSQCHSFVVPNHHTSNDDHPSRRGKGRVSMPMSMSMPNNNSTINDGKNEKNGHSSRSVHQLEEKTKTTMTTCDNVELAKAIQEYEIGSLPKTLIDIAIRKIQQQSKLQRQSSTKNSSSTQRQSSSHQQQGKQQELDEIKKATRLLSRLLNERLHGNYHSRFHVDQIMNPIINRGRHYYNNGGGSIHNNNNINSNGSGSSGNSQHGGIQEFASVTYDLLQRLEQIRLLEQREQQEYNLLHAYHENDNDETSTMTMTMTKYSYLNNNPQTMEMMKPNRKTYNMIIDLLSKSRKEDSISQIQSILQTMEQHGTTTTSSTTSSSSAILPDSISYNSLLYAISQTNYNNNPNAAKECEALLRHMQQMDKSFSSSPTTTSPSSLTTTSTTTTTTKRPNLVDTVSYNIVMNAWAKSGLEEGPKRTEDLLLEMIQLNKNDKDDTTTTTTTTTTLPLPPTIIRPNTISFTTAIDAYGRSKDLDAAVGAERLLLLMEQYQKANIITYNSVLNAWSKSSIPGAARKANDLLDRLIQQSLIDIKDEEERGGGGDDDVVKPGTISFSICIQAWAHSGERYASKYALDLLQQMKELNQITHHHHNYDDDDNDNGGRRRQVFDTAPDIVTYNAVLRALANDSTEINKAIKAEMLLRQIENSGSTTTTSTTTSHSLSPDLETYNNILRCCCTTKSNDEEIKANAIRIAVDVLLTLREATKQQQQQAQQDTTNNKNERRRQHHHHPLSPNPYTFNFFMKAIDRLCTTNKSNNNEKVKLIRAAFQFCISMGQFSQPVLSIMKNALSPQELMDILNLDKQSNNDKNNNKKKNMRSLRDLKVSDFPYEWSQYSNIKERMNRSSKGLFHKQREKRRYGR